MEATPHNPATLGTAAPGARVGAAREDEGGDGGHLGYEAPATVGGSIAASIAFFEAEARYRESIRDAEARYRAAQRLFLLTSSITTAWAETCFATLCLCGLMDLRWLMRARGVSRALRDAVDRAFSLLPGITFPAHVTGADVLAMLMRVAGANLKTVCL